MQHYISKSVLCSDYIATEILNCTDYQPPKKFVSICTVPAWVQNSRIASFRLLFRLEIVTWSDKNGLIACLLVLKYGNLKFFRNLFFLHVKPL